MIKYCNKQGVVGVSYPLIFGSYGELFQAWEMWPSPHLEKPVGSEVRQAGPTPTDRFFCGESGPHCT